MENSFHLGGFTYNLICYLKGVKTYPFSWQTQLYVGVVSGDLVCGVTDDDGDHGDPAPAIQCPRPACHCRGLPPVAFLRLLIIPVPA